MITNQTATVPAREVADLLLKIMLGEVTIGVKGETWEEAFAGEVIFVLSTGGELTVFNDCGDLDYVEAVIMPDGRECTFEDWVPTDEERERTNTWGTTGNPMDLLGVVQRQALQRVFEAAKR